MAVLPIPAWQVLAIFLNLSLGRMAVLIVLIDKDINRLERFFGGIATLKTIPDALFIVDINKEIGAVKEAATKNVPVIGIVDSNSNPTMIDFPIPANDDAVRSITLITHAVAQAYKEGKSAWQK
jgi:small subunit ribosomal protein S2